LSTLPSSLTDLTAIDCQGFAGGFTLGTVQAGFRLVGKREQKGAFGVFNCEVNRQLLGSGWKTEVGDPATAWTPYRVNFVFGNPPCSGFSTLSPKKFRGMDSKINDCMWAFAHYAASCYPEVAVFESVQAAFKKGRPLMQALRDRVESLTGRHWYLYHVLHNALSVGGCAMRKRYFWVVSQVPFGIERPELQFVPSLRSVIGDLVELPYTYGPQPYRASPSWWAEPRVDPRGYVDGHQFYDCTYIQKSLELVTHELGPWPEGQRLQNMMRLYYQRYGDLPDSWATRRENLIKHDFWCGASQLTRWRWGDPARVITGAGLESVLHPLLNRGLTHREVARIMGFPDTWEIHAFEDQKGAIRQTWGKGIPVDCGRWISSWVREAILGTPGSYVGDVIGDRESLIDVTNDYKQAVIK
jgi:site-specific DNA-cytosine methylase